MGAKKIDSKGRITIGSEYANRQYNVIENEDGSILLEPLVTIPVREKWLWENKIALSRVINGIESASNGKTADDPMTDDHKKKWLDELDQEE